MLEGFGGQVETYPTTSVKLILEGTTYQMKVAVAERNTLKGKSALLGRDIPGMRWVPTLEPRPPQQEEPPKVHPPEVVYKEVKTSTREIECKKSSPAQSLIEMKKIKEVTGSFALHTYIFFHPSLPSTSPHQL